MRENKEALTFLPRPPENYLNTTNLRNVPITATGINHVPTVTAASNTATITLAPNEAMPKVFCIMSLERWKPNAPIQFWCEGHEMKKDIMAMTRKRANRI